MKTMREFYNAVIAAEITSPNAEELKIFAKSAIEKLDAKNSKKKTTMTKAQKENVELKARMMSDFSTDEIYTAHGISIAYEISTQKASAMLRQLEKEGKLISIEKYKGEGMKSAAKGYKLVIEEEATENEETEELEENE